MKEDKILGARKVSQNISYSKLLKECEIGMSTVLIKAKILKKYISFIKYPRRFWVMVKLLRLNLISSIPKSLQNGEK